MYQTPITAQCAEKVCAKPSAVLVPSIKTSMNLEYEYRLINVENDVQDKSSVAWKKLCEYVEKVAKEGNDEFSPFEYLGKELYSQIYTLPESIAKLKKVKKIWLYGSQLKRLPPEVGEMEALEYLDTYTSYNLHWFPYEITNCKNLKDSRVSTRALYGNYKYRRPFPDLTNNPVRYEGETLKCSVCKKELTYQQTNQFWISLQVGTDVLPLLVNLCSEECNTKLPQPPKNYVVYPHKGGAHTEQPLDEHTLWQIEWEKIQVEQNSAKPKIVKEKIAIKGLHILKIIQKIWKR